MRHGCRHRANGRSRPSLASYNLQDANGIATAQAGRRSADMPSAHSAYNPRQTAGRSRLRRRPPRHLTTAAELPPSTSTSQPCACHRLSLFASPYCCSSARGGVFQRSRFVLAHFAGRRDQELLPRLLWLYLPASSLTSELAYPPAALPFTIAIDRTLQTRAQRRCDACLYCKFFSDVLNRRGGGR